MRRLVCVWLLSLTAILSGYAQTKAPGKNTPTQATKKSTESKPPVKFSLNLISAEKEESVPDSIRVEGLTNDDRRYVLSCPFGLPRRSVEEMKSAQKDAHLASQDPKLPTLSIFNPDNTVFVVCVILNRVVQAKDVFTVRVLSSQAVNLKDGRGFQVEANGSAKIFKLECARGPDKNSPCTTVRAGNYRAIRDGTDMRLCDADLVTISRYKIVGERPGA